MILFLVGFTEIIIMDITKISQWFPLPLCRESRPYPNPNPDTDLRGLQNRIYSLVFNKFTCWHSTNLLISYTPLWKSIFTIIPLLTNFTQIIVMDITKRSLWSPLPLYHESRPYPNPNPDTDLCGFTTIV